MSQGSLARALSQLEGFASPKLELEQYETPGDIAAELLWSAHMRGDIDEKSVLDLGAGTGILGIGALILGANVTFLEKDPDAIGILTRNLQGFEDYTIMRTDATNASGSYDTIVMNPPFGAQERHADRSFLVTAMRLSRAIYSIHNANSLAFLNALYASAKWHLEVIGERALALPARYAHHTKPHMKQAVILCRSTNV
jgi:putative methylase